LGQGTHHFIRDGRRYGGGAAVQKFDNLRHGGNLLKTSKKQKQSSGKKPGCVSDEMKQNEALTREWVFGFITAPFIGEEFIMYAVLETGSKQYRVTAGDTLEIERLEIEAGKPVTFDRILMVNTKAKSPWVRPRSRAPPWWPTSSSTFAARKS